MTEPSTPMLAFTNANLATGRLGLHSPAWIGEFAREAGFDGVEYHPLYYSAKRVARAHLRGELALTSLHASFRVGLDSRDTNKPPTTPDRGAERLINSPLGRIIMPEMCASAGWMRQIQTRIGGHLPAVFYPQSDAARDGQMLLASASPMKLFQPTDHVARLLGTTSARDLASRMHGRGYDGFCIDTFHLRRRYGRQNPGVVSQLGASLQWLLPHAKALHLSLNRQDLAAGEPHIQTRKELKDALQGEYKGELRHILDAARERGRIGYAVVELTSRDLAAVTGHGGHKSLRSAYADIVAGLREYFAARADKSISGTDN